MMLKNSKFVTKIWLVPPGFERGTISWKKLPNFWRKVPLKKKVLKCRNNKDYRKGIKKFVHKETDANSARRPMKLTGKCHNNWPMSAKRKIMTLMRFIFQEPHRFVIELNFTRKKYRLKCRFSCIQVNLMIYVIGI